MMSLLATMCSVSRINADLRYLVFVCMSMITAYNVRLVYTVHCTVYGVRGSVKYTVYTIQCTMYADLRYCVLVSMYMNTA